MESKRGLSKTTFKTGHRCERALWLDFHRPELADERFGDPSAAMGTEVGVLAREYFCDTVNADMLDENDPVRLRRAADETALLIASGCPCIAEATFYRGPHKCQVDLLRLLSDGTYEMVEVKSASNVREKTKAADIRKDYLLDVGFQLWILQGAGISVSSVCLMHPDKDYQLDKELDLKSYFTFEDATCEAQRIAASIEALREADELLEVATAAEEPECECGEQCCSPKCPYLGHCLPDAAREDSVVWVGGMARKKAISLIKAGTVTMADLLAREGVEAAAAAEAGKKRKGMSDGALLQLAGKPSVDKERLREWLLPLEGKQLHWLDFETWQLPIPRFQGDKPWEQVPTQYSLHVTSPDGGVRHSEFLACAGDDPWEGIAESLAADIPADATVIAYNMSFERDRICGMAEKRLDLAPRLLSAIGEGECPCGSLVDLIVPFRKNMVYMPAMRGSKSIKMTLPALFPDDAGLDYHNLANHGETAPLVQNGSMASTAFAAMEHMEDEAQVEATRENLLRYCELDTWAMVKIWLRLRELAGFDPLPNLPVEAVCPLHADCEL